jgi:hypothetical protein
LPEDYIALLKHLDKSHAAGHGEYMGWNPMGDASFKFLNLTITSTVDSEGTVQTDPTFDQII